jgi:uncharacterized SAM-binding protein YcdF (DUF218 family)
MTVLTLLAHVLSNPILLALMLAVAGLLLVRARRRRAGAWFIAAGGLLAYLASTSLVGDALLAPLERQFPPFDPATAVGVRDIVVLGSGYAPDSQIPVTGALDADGLARIVEGVRLALSRPDSRLLVSGGAPPGFAPAAWGYARMATELGLGRASIVVMDRSLTTEQEATEVAAVLGHAPFILVTSAYHMPRAIRLMRLAGANPLPAPTGNLVQARRATDGIPLMPGSRGLRKTEAALHEYLGLAGTALPRH